MEAVSGSEARAGRISLARLLWAGPLAGGGAAAVNAVVYLLASGLGAIPQDVVVPGQGPITLAPVVVSSFVPALLGAGSLALLARFTQRPVRIFRIAAVVALVLSFVTPLSLVGAPASMVLALLLMHVVAAAVIVGVLTTLARARGASGISDG